MLALIFILSGISKIGGYTATVAHMEAAGIPMAPIFLYGAVLVELGAGLMVLTGFRARIASPRYFLDLISCRSGCPVRTNAGAYVRAVAEGRKRKITVDLRKLDEYLGPTRFDYGELEAEDQTGSATGLVVTGASGTWELATFDELAAQGRAPQRHPPCRSGCKSAHWC